MPNRKKASRKSSNSSGRASSGENAISLLKADHDKVLKLFEQFDKARTDDKAQTLAQQICQELKVHTTIEEEIFYPAARAAIDDDDLLDEAAVEHASAKELIEQIESGSAEDDKWCAKVTVLGEYIRHHVKEEQGELFTKVRNSDVDLKELGAQLFARKKKLMNGEGKAPRSRRDTAKQDRQTEASTAH